MNVQETHRMLRTSAGLAVLLLGCMFPPVAAAEIVHGRITFVGTLGEARHADGTLRAQFRFRVSESTCGATEGLWTNTLNGGPLWTGWTQVAPQPLASDPAAISLGPSHMAVFALGTDGHMYTMKWNGTGWSVWFQIGSHSFKSGPAVTSWGPNRLDLFARGVDDALWSNSWTGGAEWIGWEKRAPNAIASDPAAVAWGSGRIDVFARGTDNKMYTMVFGPTGWGGWAPLPSNDTFTSGPAVASPSANTLELFARGLNNALWTNSLTGGSQWTGWTQRAPQAIASEADAIFRGSNRIDLFARRPDNQMYTMFRDGGQWTDWAPLGSERFVGGPAVASPGPGRLDVFARGSLRADRWIHVTSGRMDGDFEHNSANFRNAYNTVLSGFLARTAVNVMVYGVPSCDETQAQTVALESSTIGIYP